MFFKEGKYFDSVCTFMITKTCKIILKDDNFYRLWHLQSQCLGEYMLAVWITLVISFQCLENQAANL